MDAVVIKGREELREKANWHTQQKYIGCVDLIKKKIVSFV